MNNKVLEAIQTHNKAVIWWQSIGSTIVKYNYQFMNQARVAAACGENFQFQGVINIFLKYKHSGVGVSELDSITKKALKNKLRKRLMAVLFIDNSNRRIYSKLFNTLENDCLIESTTIQIIWPLYRLC